MAEKEEEEEVGKIWHGTIVRNTLRIILSMLSPQSVLRLRVVHFGIDCGSIVVVLFPHNKLLPLPLSSLSIRIYLNSFPSFPFRLYVLLKNIYLLCIVYIYRFLFISDYHIITGCRFCDYVIKHTHTRNSLFSLFSPSDFGLMCISASGTDNRAYVTDWICTFVHFISNTAHTQHKPQRHSKNSSTRTLKLEKERKYCLALHHFIFDRR